MWNCRWLLCLFVMGLATGEVSSMNGEQSRSKNDSSKTTESGSSLNLNRNSEGKKKPYDGHTAERDQMPSPSSLMTADSTSSNGRVALVEGGASTSANATARLSHSKRHFHRSKLYRKESRTKSRASMKSNVANNNLISFSTGRRIVPSLDLPHNSDHNSDRIKPVESTSRTSNSTLNSAATASHNDSIPTNSSMMTAGSENWYNSSTSSDSGSIVDEKSSSVELMAFTFENMDAAHQPTLSNDLEKRLEILTQSYASIGVDRSSSTTLMTPSSDRSTDKAKSTAADLASDRIDRGQSVQTAKSSLNDDPSTYSVHGDQKTNETSASAKKDGDMSKDDSVSVASRSSVSSRSTYGSSLERGSANRSTAENFGSNYNHSRPVAEGFSWVSIDDSLNRISLTEVADTLKTIASRESRDFHSHSNSTVSNDSDRPELPKRSHLPTPGPGIAQHPREPRTSTSSDPEFKFPGHSHASPPVSKFDHPLKLTFPLSLEAMVKPRVKTELVAEEGGLSKPSSSPKRSSTDKNVESSNSSSISEPSPSQCSSSSSTERPSHVRRRDGENPFHRHRSGDVSLAFRGTSIPEIEHCLTTGAIVSSVMPLESEENEADVTNSSNQSHPTDAEDDRGGQSLLAPSIIVLESFEPAVLESLASEEAAVPVDDEMTTSGHFFAAFPDLEEHCNASSFNVFIPSVNSGKTVAAKEEPSLVDRAEAGLNRKTTEDNLYIMEGFGFFKDNIDDLAEIDDDLDRRRDAPFDYPETEIYPGYPQVDDHPPPLPLELIHRSDFQVESPAKQEPLAASDLRGEGNRGDRSYDPWWLNDVSRRRGGQAVRKDDFDQRTVFILSGFATPKEIPAVHLSGDDIVIDSEIHNYRTFLLPTVYVFIGICVVVIGCSIWCSGLSVKRQTQLPKLTHFIQERYKAAETV